MKYNKGEGINSSKVYCKCSSSNKRRKICQSINSSKVYCKFTHIVYPIIF